MIVTDSDYDGHGVADEGDDEDDNDRNDVGDDDDDHDSDGFNEGIDCDSGSMGSSS